MAKERNPNFYFNAIRDNTDLYTPLNITGRAPSLGTSPVPVTIWDGNSLYVFPTSANWEIVSDSANDTLAGTGAINIEMQFLDDNFDRMGEDGKIFIEMNGTTPVPITEANGAKRCNSAIVINSGSLRTNDGTITIREVGNPTNIIAQINPNTSNALPGFFTVPKGFRAYITDVVGSINRGGTGASDREVDVDFRMTIEGTNTSMLIAHQHFTESNNFVYRPAVPIRIEEATDIESLCTEVLVINSDVMVIIAGLLERL